MPRSAMTAMTAGLISPLGFEPPDHAQAALPARRVKNPMAIWDRPALWLHRNYTTGLTVVLSPLPRWLGRRAFAGRGPPPEAQKGLDRKGGRRAGRRRSTGTPR